MAKAIKAVRPEAAKRVKLPRVPNRLRELRARAGLTQVKVADNACPPTSKSVYERLENGKMVLTHEWMVSLAPAFKVRPAALIDPLVELIPYAEGGGDLTQEFADRLLLLDIWDALPRSYQATMLKMMQDTVALMQAAKVG